MARFLFSLPDEQLEGLRSLSSGTGVPIAQFLRQAVDSILHGQTSCNVVVSGCIASGVIMMIRGN